MIELTHGTLIRVPTWSHGFAKVGTLKGYCKELSDKILARGNGPLTWTSSTLTVADSAEHCVDRHIVVAAGDLVEIEGIVYEVVVVNKNWPNPRNSSPVYFIPA